MILGLNLGLINESEYSWTNDYVTVTGDLRADLLSNIASEQRVFYEYLYHNCIGAFMVPDRRKILETDIIMETREA